MLPTIIFLIDERGKILCIYVNNKNTSIVALRMYLDEEEVHEFEYERK